MGDTMSMVEIAKVAHQAGFRGEDLRIAVAVAWAESGGDPKVNSHYPGEDSRGLWQINSVHFDRYDESRLYQPRYNAEAARDIWRDSKQAGNPPWYPWSTWRFGQYEQYLDEASRAVKRAHLVVAATEAAATTAATGTSTTSAPGGCRTVVGP